ncbi:MULTISPECIES: S9 family peptidase [unclassified Tolypothrix]|uniref:S9 family peptidase n=1 Tax=unclassified Tolypothrix TaxID=2649714 RepID=UPI0005EAAB20|nr:MULTISPECIES: oligopeptidase B [unclassified Tolypothrix]BAY88731.1 oligopeptidase B [Microchaete diplosiphon NIES-3275]EKF01609.1 peptidase, S9A family, beta-propeller domain protein [Tolypothrix sp. PCC 7601]MBE9085853.1 oligopeptidase B [Tolypothrix sp. LEGE 11397]UYD29393.1 oligopeptidase B [Tolypothrix sp. PCC 7712]UYD34700.1 oligopeptidase B [Tolypothrix sp. PCC 7601]
MSQNNFLQNLTKPPVADQHPEVLELHGDRRIDNYFWLRDVDNPQVIAYLEAENSYTAAMMQHTESLQTKLYNEMLARIKETDLSVPYLKDNYYYYLRTEEGKNYPIYCRKKDNLSAPEEILLDENELAKGHEFFSLGVFDISPNHQILAYSVDTSGSEQYTLFFLDLTTHQLLSETIPDTYFSFAWANDNQTVFYTKIDDANRPYQLFSHILGTTPDADVLLYEEADELYHLYVDKTRSQAYILMSLRSSITTEVHYLDANHPQGNWQLIHPRTTGMEYDVDHHSDYFYIVTNDEATNFKLVKTLVASPSKANWQTLIPHQEDILLSGISLFANHLVIYERKGGLETARVKNLATGEESNITFPEPTYEFYEGNNPEFNTTILRFHYTSFITPQSVFDYNMETQQRELKKETEVLGGYDRTQYQSEWLMATANDGTKIPISIVYKQGIKKDSQNPLLLTGYGAYGSSYPATFSSNRLTLLDRGILFAIAHIRGGEEMGRKWYEDGKFLQKKNTFTDFIACAEYLINEKWTASDRLVITGGSAGGLLMGAVMNLRPELFKAVVAHVPFVDIVTTILDTSLPLSAMEWEEWGNPNDPVYYDYMKSYSPYDNVEAKDYPDMLITAGLNDSRVKYWEPAKWTAKLRELKTDNNILLLKTNMGAGHSGASGRYESLRELAFEYAFILDRLGLGTGD